MKLKGSLMEAMVNLCHFRVQMGTEWSALWKLLWMVGRKEGSRLSCLTLVYHYWKWSLVTLSRACSRDNYAISWILPWKPGFLHPLEKLNTSVGSHFYKVPQGSLCVCVCVKQFLFSIQVFNKHTQTPDPLPLSRGRGERKRLHLSM